MPQAISIRSDHRTSEKIRSLWTQCSALERKPSMAAMAYPPHISLAVYDKLAEEDLFAGLAKAKKRLSKTIITFASLSYFESPDSIILWAVPSLPENVLAAHNSIHTCIDQSLCHEHYRPENWVPHCSLATSISPDRKHEALALIAEPMEPIEVVFDTVDCVSFMPVEVLREFPLSS